MVGDAEVGASVSGGAGGEGGGEEEEEGKGREKGEWL